MHLGKDYIVVLVARAKDLIAFWPNNILLNTMKIKYEINFEFTIF